MRTIVIGCGRIGAELAVTLSGAGRDVVVVDLDDGKFRRLGTAFNGVAIRGDGRDEAVLREAGMESCEAFVAVTDSDSTNMMTAEIASRIFGVPRVVVRLCLPERERSVRILGLDHVCDATLAVRAITEKLSSLAPGPARMPDHAQARPRGPAPPIPPGKGAGGLFVVINGGDAIGSYLARTLHGKGYAIAVLEKRPELARRLAEEMSTDILLIEGDGCDAGALEEAGAGRADVFASVTPNDDENLVSCRLAKLEFGVRRVVARVNEPSGDAIFHRQGIEAISSTTIIGRLIEEEVTVGDVLRLHTLQKGMVALVETTIPEGDRSPAGRRVADLGLPEGIVLVSLVRGETVLIPRGSTTLEPGDRVLAMTIAGKEPELVRYLHGNGAGAPREARA